MTVLGTHEGLLIKEERLGTRAVAHEILHIEYINLQGFHLLWLARRNYSIDLFELIERIGCQVLDCIPNDRISELFNHMPNNIATRLANKIFWYASFNRRIFLRPYMSSRLGIKVFNQESLKLIDISFESERFYDVVTYCVVNGLLETSVEKSKTSNRCPLEICLTEAYKIIVPVEDNEKYRSHYNFGLKATFDPVIRTITYQSMFLKEKAFCINDVFGATFRSTQQQLVMCGNLGAVIFYFFPCIKKIIAVRGWIAWPILIYDINNRTIANINHKQNENIEEFRPYLESLHWSENGKRNDDVALLIGFNANIGHFYHNELSALHNLYLTGDIKYIDRIICYKYVPIKLKEYINFLNKNILIHEFLSDKDTIDDVNNCRLALRITDLTVSKSLATSLINFSRENFTYAPFQRSSASVRVLFTIRTGRRRLLNQIEIFIEAIKLLQVTFGRILIIFDGITAVNWQDISRFVQEEESVASQVIQAFAASNNIEFETIIGKTLEQKIVVISQCDFAITVKGNGLLPTVQWIANIPTFVHGNSTDLGIFWEASLGEDLERPFVLSPSVVQDGSSKLPITAGTWSDRQVDSYQVPIADFLSQLSIFLRLQFQ